MVCEGSWNRIAKSGPADPSDPIQSDAATSAQSHASPIRAQYGLQYRSDRRNAFMPLPEPQQRATGRVPRIPWQGAV
jgi:hypothetical protein